MQSVNHMLTTASLVTSCVTIDLLLLKTCMPVMLARISKKTLSLHLLTSCNVSGQFPMHKAYVAVFPAGISRNRSTSLLLC